MRRSRVVPLVGLVAVLAAGCPLGPNYRRPEVVTPPDFHGQVEPVEAASLADRPWWDVFQDETLRGLIDQALDENYDLVTAIQRVEQARYTVWITRSEMLPQVGYQGSASRQRAQVLPGTGRTFNLFSGAFNVAWEVDLWGRVRRATEASQADMYASEFFRRGVMLALVSEVATGYFTLLELDRELEIARNSVQVFGETFELFTRQFTGGVGSKLAVERAAASLAAAEATVPQLEQQIIAQENVLSVLLGQNPAGIPRGETLHEQVRPPDTPPGLPSALLERRPDVLEAEEAMRAANALVGAAVADFFPRIGLTALYGAQSTDLGNITSGAASVWSIASAVAGPIFTSGQRYGQYKARVAQWEQTKAQWEQTLLQAFSEVSNALVAQTKLKEVRASRERQVKALEESVRLSLMRYDLGLSNYYEVLEAEQQLFPAQNQLAQATRDQLLAVVDLYRALGGGWSLSDEAFVEPAADFVPQTAPAVGPEGQPLPEASPLPARDEPPAYDEPGYRPPDDAPTGYEPPA